MSRTLLLVRHAKAQSDGPTDAERPLAPRGVRDAEAAGRWLAAHQLVPDQAVVSPALRARQTWEAMAASLGTVVPSSTDSRIYDNTVEALLAVLREVAGDVVALVGHNPSMHALALALDEGGELPDGFPTMSIAVFSVPGEWEALDLGGARLREHAVPRG